MMFSMASLKDNVLFKSFAKDSSGLKRWCQTCANYLNHLSCLNTDKLRFLLTKCESANTREARFSVLGSVQIFTQTPSLRQMRTLSNSNYDRIECEK